MSKMAFLIPIHSPHFKYAKRIIDSFHLNGLNEQADLWFIFTDEKEKEEFGEYENNIILPKELRNFDNRGIINIKKFYGLSQIKNKYEYIIVLDAEVLFVKNVDLEKICSDYFDAKILYGNKQLSEGLKRTEPIKNNCKRFFVNNENLNKINDDLYLWFNQPCIYKTSTLDEFFEIINYKENAAKFTWHDFDYYIYMYYLILYHNFRVEDIEIESNYGICEAGLDYLYFKSNKYENIPIYMCSQATLKQFDNPNLFIICHLDRDDVWMMRVTNIKIDNLSNKIEDSNRKIDYLSKELGKHADLYEELNKKFDSLSIELSSHADLYKELNKKFDSLSIDLIRQKEILEQQINTLNAEFIRYRKRKSSSYRIKKFFSIFIPNKEIRRKIRGD